MEIALQARRDSARTALECLQLALDARTVAYYRLADSALLLPVLTVPEQARETLSPIASKRAFAAWRTATPTRGAWWVQAPEGERLGALVVVCNRALSPAERALGERHAALLGTLVQPTQALDRQAVEAFKNRFLSTVSHELRTPLSGIIGFGEFLSEGLYGPLSPPQAQAMGEVIKNSQRLMTLVDTLLDLARLTVGELGVEAEPFELGALAREACARQAGAASAKGLALVSPEGPLGWAEADPRRVLQILQQLLENAVKFTPSGGRVVLDVSSAPGAKWLVSVADTGVGIPQDHLPRLFSRFEQGDGSSTRRFGGVGTGLALARELLEVMGERIWAESTPGLGTRVTFSLRRLEPVG